MGNENKMNRVRQETQTAQVNNHIQNSSIKLAHTNINSIRNKLDDIAAELSDYDVICVSETKLNNSILSTNLMLNSYNMPIRKDRETNNGGGLIIYVKNNICFKRRQDLENNSIENIWIEVQALNNKFLLGLFYRPPEAKAEYWVSFENIIENASEENLNIIIMGDLNHDILKQYNKNKLSKILSKFNLQNLITEPTRVDNKSSTCIDLILTNHNAIITNTNVLPPFNSDHCTVTAEITFKTFKALAYQKTIWKYDEADLTSTKNKFSSIDWSFIENGNNLNIINEKFNDILIDIAEQCIPKVSFTSLRFRPHMFKSPCFTTLYSRKVDSRGLEI